MSSLSRRCSMQLLISKSFMVDLGSVVLTSVEALPYATENKLLDGTGSTTVLVVMTPLETATMFEDKLQISDPCHFMTQVRWELGHIRLDDVNAVITTELNRRKLVDGE
jgi:hypothetical protein